MDLAYVSKTAARHAELAENFVIDEIQKHLDYRFVCPNESVWHILEYATQAKSHHIERLPIHLKDEHVINLGGEGDMPEDEDDPMLAINSKLTAYFAYNASLAENERFYYHELPRECRWDYCKKEVRMQAFLEYILNRTLNDIGKS
jgi:hypothetical protein